MFKDNQLSTLLILLGLGFLIYIMTKPKAIAQVMKTQESEKGSEQIKEGFDTETEGEVLAQVLNEVETNTAGVNDFVASDNGSAGASLDVAYDNPLPADMSADAINMNANNVKNYDAKDFLPQEVNDEWFNTDFSQAKYNLNENKLINTDKYIIGVNTVGQSLKNASYDIRGTIANPKFSISPWNNSTYEPDYNLKPLC